MQTTEKVLPLFSSEVFFKKLSSLFHVVICGGEVENKISMKPGSENMRIGSWGLISLFVIRRHDEQTHHPFLILMTSHFNHKIGFYLLSLV